MPDLNASRFDERRILMTADAVGGIWQYAVDLTRGLCARGAEVTLAVFGPSPTATQSAETHDIDGLRVISTGLALDWTASDSSSVRQASAAVRSLAHKAGADLVHLNHAALAAHGGFDVPCLIACHSCVATWWQAVRGGELPADLAWRRDLVAAGYAAADLLTAPSAAFAAATAACHGVTMPLVVHNGRNAANKSRIQADGRQGMAQLPKFFAFTAGRLWDEGKNISTLDWVASHLDVPFLAAGPLQGANGARIGLKHLRHCGELDNTEMGAHLFGGPVFVSAARYEPFGLAVLEAAQAGCALVLSDIASFREIWADAADYVTCDDGAGFATAIQRLIDRPALRQERAAAAGARAGRYTAAAMSTGVAMLHTERLGGSSGSVRSGREAGA